MGPLGGIVLVEYWAAIDRDYTGLYRGYIRMMEKNMETTISGLGLKVNYHNTGYVVNNGAFLLQ